MAEFRFVSLLISGSCLFHLPFIDEVFDDSIIRMGDFAGGGARRPRRRAAKTVLIGNLVV
jgi:hypothetical protein